MSSQKLPFAAVSAKFYFSPTASPYNERRPRRHKSVRGNQLANANINALRLIDVHRFGMIISSSPQVNLERLDKS